MAQSINQPFTASPFSVFSHRHLAQGGCISSSVPVRGQSTASPVPPRVTAHEEEIYRGCHALGRRTLQKHTHFPTPWLCTCPKWRRDTSLSLAEGTRQRNKHVALGHEFESAEQLLEMFCGVQLSGTWVRASSSAHHLLQCQAAQRGPRW